MPPLFGFKELKAGFFDTKAVMSAVDKQTRRVLSQVGGYVRKVARSSLKYQDGKSTPGSPPVVHRSKGFTRAKKDRKTGTIGRQPTSPLRELIFYAIDPATESVLVGPVRFTGSKSSGSAPGVLEVGGTSSFIDPKTGQRKRGNYSARPFIKPAGDVGATKFSEILRSMVG